MFQRKHKQKFPSLCTDRKKRDCKSILVCAWERIALHVCDQTILNLCPDTHSVLNVQPMVGEPEELLETCYVFHLELATTSFRGFHSCNHCKQYKHETKHLKHNKGNMPMHTQNQVPVICFMEDI